MGGGYKRIFTDGRGLNKIPPVNSVFLHFFVERSPGNVEVIDNNFNVSLAFSEGRFNHKFLEIFHSLVEGK